MRERVGAAGARQVCAGPGTGPVPPAAAGLEPEGLAPAALVRSEFLVWSFNRVPSHPAAP